jgi:tRNA A-37 threonylcarbamoyl transferase component Bud32
MGRNLAARLAVGICPPYVLRVTGATERLSAALADRYRIERPLGQGGMATVYLAEDLKHKRHVAVKVLKPELAAVLGAERFVQEITTTASLSHPHILPLFDSGSADGFLFYVMPFVEGETLRDKLNRETQLGVDEAVRIAGEVADALDYAHRHGVIHRDIKPENILLHDGRPMVADFGIALAVSAAAGGRMTETGLSLGTPHYMSPEQATAEKEITARSDVYSLASVLYEMLAGQPPHLGGSAQQIIMKIIAEPVAAVTQYRRSVPPHVAGAVAKALEKLPADRFASAREFAQALANPAFLHATTDAASPDGSTRATAGGRGMRWSWPLLAGVAGVGLLAGSALGPLWRESPPVEAVRRLEVAFPRAERPRYGISTSTNLDISLSGEDFIYAGPGVGKRTQLWRRRWDAPAATRIATSPDETCCVRYSPAGDSIAFLTAPARLWVLGLAGGAPRLVRDTGLVSVTDFSGGLDWHEDGFIYHATLRGLARVRSSGADLGLVAPVDTARGDAFFAWPDVLPGGRHALVTILSGLFGNAAGSTVALADLRTGIVTPLAPAVRAMHASEGEIVLVRADGTLHGARLDARAGRLIGNTVPTGDTLSVLAISPDLALSRDGTLLYDARVARLVTLVAVDRTGRAEPLTTLPAATFLDSPRVDRTGRRLLVGIAAEDGRIDSWIVSLVPGEPARRLTFEGFANIRATWRPGTAAITLSSDIDAPGGAIFLHEITPLNSFGLRRVAVGDPRGIGGHEWSPDGRWLLIRTDDQFAGNADILALRPGIDTVPIPLVASEAEELAPTVSPDGRWLAYSSNVSGRREIYVSPFPETSRARFQASTIGGVGPRWSRDGSTLYFVDAEQRMVAVTVGGGRETTFGPPQVLFDASTYFVNAFTTTYDLHPDGRFVMVRFEAPAEPRLVVVTNFREELRRKLAAP